MSDYPLQHIEIDGFRGFDNFTLPKLGRVNVLVGGNNSGKTSLLEAIALLCAPTDPDKMLEVVRGRDPGAIDESRLHSLRWCFTRKQPVAKAEEWASTQCTLKMQGAFGLAQLDIVLDEVVAEPDQQDRRRAERLGLAVPLEKQGVQITYYPRLAMASSDEWPAMPAQGFKMLVWELVGRVRRGSAQAKLHVPCSVIYPYSYQLNPEQVRSLSPLLLDGENAVLIELLQLFDPDVLNVDIGSSRGDRPAIYLKHRRLGLAPLSVFGDAMRRSVLLASTLSALPKGGVLLLDEVEAGVHVEAQQRFFAWLINAAHQRDVQVFMTTHSLEALDAMLLGQANSGTDKDIVVYQLKREPDAVHCKRFAGDLLHRLRFERGLDVR